MPLYITVEPTESVLMVNRNLTGYIINMTGDRLERFELQKGLEFYNNSYYGSIQATHDAFRIMYIGYGKNGETIQRVQPPVIRPQEFEVEISVQNSNLRLTPNDTAKMIVILKNHGPGNTFTILVSDDKSFVSSYSPKNVTVKSKDSVGIQINFRASLNTSDSTTTSVSVSASIQSTFAADLANFISFEVSVFSKEFRFVNETVATSKRNISSLLIIRPDDGNRTQSTLRPKSDAHDGRPMLGTILIVVCCMVMLV
ncbi:uncharacterized protein LOC114520962 [Dendronephthya gigantea]|uniref:uncharacterized protein LOC114520962 n=1 Tax=Dendronephthya gigantea TaxID=151771 RepID=UPI00106CE1AD|nr:uncharacterized protein LOC114520962 [Dendronephthya gigantea]